VRTRSRGAVQASFTLLFLAACGSSADAPRYTLQTRLGVYDDGSGRLGTALLATLRDGSGAGPSEPWTITLRDGDGTTVAALQSQGGPGAYVASWYASAAPSPGTYEVVAQSGLDSLRVKVSLTGAEGLPLPAPIVAEDGSRIDWEPVPGAAAYLCRVYAGGALWLEAAGTSTTCDLSDLPPGGYSAAVLALSADLAALGSSTAVAPPLPRRFDASEARLGIARGEGPAPVVLSAAGGAYDDGVDARSLAVWLSVTAADGSATSTDWEIEVVGPNLPASAPLELTYHANFPRTLAWAPGIPAAPGTYVVTVRSGTSAAVTQFAVGSPAWLDQPLGLEASAVAQGSASFSWEPVAGAKSYLVSAYDAETGALHASAWFTGTGGSFPANSFEPDHEYDTFLAATDADMAPLGEVPTQVSVAENVFDFVRFVAK
jgi:hypothetical protein